MKKTFALWMLICLFMASGCAACAEESGSVLNDILQRGTLRVGTTGDYKPMSFFDQQTGEYWLSLIHI